MAPWRHKYHIVFCPKYRYRIFKDAMVEYVRQQVYQLCKQKEQVVVLELNVQPDHVHGENPQVCPKAGEAGKASRGSAREVVRLAKCNKSAPSRRNGSKATAYGGGRLLFSYFAINDITIV